VLRDEGHVVDRKRVRRLMRLMEIEALAPRPSTSTPAPGHKVCLDRLRGLDVTQPNRVWTAELASMPDGGGWP
jgi:putative transposase